MIDISLIPYILNSCYYIFKTSCKFKTRPQQFLFYIIFLQMHRLGWTGYRTQFLEPLTLRMGVLEPKVPRCLWGGCGPPCQILDLGAQLSGHLYRH